MSLDLGGPVTGIDHAEVRRRHSYHAVTVKRVVRETADASSYVLDVPADLKELFRYRAGQFCTFRVRLGDGADGGEQLRSYSMSSAEETDEDLTVTVKRVPGGLVSNWFNEHVGEGDVLEVTKPAGVFCLRDTDGPVVAYCGGSGVTPVISVAKSALATTTRPVRVLYANRDRDSVIFEGDLQRLQAAHPDRLEVVHHYDCDEGFLDAAAVAQFADGAAGADFYVCGPEPFMDLVEGTLLSNGVAREHILIERFDHVTEPSRPEQSGVEATTETVTIVLKGQQHPISYRAGDTVLETARRGALAPPFSCEAGNCATCMAIVRVGTASMRANNALTDDEVTEGWVLTCQAVPTSPTLTVEYEDM